MSGREPTEPTARGLLLHQYGHTMEGYGHNYGSNHLRAGRGDGPNA